MLKKILLINLFILSIFMCSCTKANDNINNNEKENETETEIIDAGSDEALNSYIKDLMNKTTSYTPCWNQESFKNRWNYIDGVFLKSIIDAYNKTNDKAYIDFVVNYVNYYIDSDGNFVCPDSEAQQQTPYIVGELDSACESRILFDLYEYTNDSRYINAIDNTYNYLLQQPTLENGYSYSHKTSYANQIWLDGMYMYVPFLARYALLKNDSSIFNTIKLQYQYIKDNMYDSSKSLYYHGYDDTKSIFWANSTTGCSQSFWLRSMGWYITSLADLLEYVPENNTNREYFVNLYKEAVDGILKYLDTDSNMFYQVIDKKGQGANVSYDFYLKPLGNKKYTSDAYIENYLESSGSSLISYSILKGASLNVLTDSYKTIGQNIFNGVYNHSFSDNRLNDICITAGLGPDGRTYRDGSFEYYLAEPVGSNDAKGVGPFIMAYLAI